MNKATVGSDAPEQTRRLLDFHDLRRDYKISRPTAYRLLAAGKLKSVKILGRRFILADSAEALLSEAL